jgi:hypothetical protein
MNIVIQVRNHNKNTINYIAYSNLIMNYNKYYRIKNVTFSFKLTAFIITNKQGGRSVLIMLLM